MESFGIHLFDTSVLSGQEYTRQKIESFFGQVNGTIEIVKQYSPLQCLQCINKDESIYPKLAHIAELARGSDDRSDEALKYDAALLAKFAPLYCDSERRQNLLEGLNLLVQQINARLPLEEREPALKSIELAQLDALDIFFKALTPPYDVDQYVKEIDVEHLSAIRQTAKDELERSFKAIAKYNAALELFEHLITNCKYAFKEMSPKWATEGIWYWMQPLPHDQEALERYFTLIEQHIAPELDENTRTILIDRSASDLAEFIEWLPQSQALCERYVSKILEPLCEKGLAKLAGKIKTMPYSFERLFNSLGGAPEWSIRYIRNVIDPAFQYAQRRLGSPADEDNFDAWQIKEKFFDGNILKCLKQPGKKDLLNAYEDVLASAQTERPTASTNVNLHFA